MSSSTQTLRNSYQRMMITLSYELKFVINVVKNLSLRNILLTFLVLTSHEYSYADISKCALSFLVRIVNIREPNYASITTMFRCFQFQQRFTVTGCRITSKRQGLDGVGISSETLPTQKNAVKRFTLTSNPSCQLLYLHIGQQSAALVVNPPHRLSTRRIGYQPSTLSTNPPHWLPASGIGYQPFFLVNNPSHCLPILKIAFLPIYWLPTIYIGYNPSHWFLTHHIDIQLSTDSSTPVHPGKCLAAGTKLDKTEQFCCKQKLTLLQKTIQSFCYRFDTSGIEATIPLYNSKQNCVTFHYSYQLYY